MVLFAIYIKAWCCNQSQYLSTDMATVMRSAMNTVSDSGWLAIGAVVAVLLLRIAFKWLATLLDSPIGRPSALADPNAGPPTRSLRGPFNLPVLGYLPFLGKMPHRKFKLLSEKYGPIFK